MTCLVRVSGEDPTEALPPAAAYQALSLHHGRSTLVILFAKPDVAKKDATFVAALSKQREPRLLTYCLQ